MPQVQPLWVVVQGRIIVANGLLEVLLLDAAESTQLVESRHIGIAPYSLRTVTLGSGKIV